MTPKISALVSDVDGTLVTDDKILIPRAQGAVADLHTRGIIFTIISSRPPRGLRMLLEPLGITTPVGGFNGGVIATPDLAVVSEHLLSSDCPEVKQKADFVTDSNSEDGFANAIERIILGGHRPDSEVDVARASGRRPIVGRALS